MNFSCSGTISKWSFVAMSQTGQGRDQYPLFQLWRPNGTGQYERVYESSSDSGEMLWTMVDEPGLTVAEYVPQNPVPFQADDILGVYQPRDVGDSRLTLWHISVPNNYGHHRNYFRDLGMSLEVFNRVGSRTGNDYPLVAVNTSENEQIKSGAYEPPALCCS